MSSIIYIGTSHHKRVFSVHPTTLARITTEDACCCIYDPVGKHLEAFLSNAQVADWGEEQVGVTVEVQHVYLPDTRPLLAVSFSNEEREYYFYFIGKSLSAILSTANKYRLNNKDNMLMDEVIEEYLLSPPNEA